MTSRELLYVKTIADEMSISQAAKKLFIAQPSLSQSLQRLEESLGTQLFNRTTNRMTLTYAGERYYETACQILKLYENLETEISDINGLKTGRIHIGITNHLGTIVLPKVLPEFHRECPFVEITVFEENTQAQEAKLISRELDFAILHAPKHDPNPLLNYEILGNDSFVLAVCPEHPLIKKAQKQTGYPYPVLDPKYLKNESFIMLHKEQRIRHVTDAILQQAGIEPDILLTVKNYETAQSLAGQGMGVTFLPLSYANLISMEYPPVLLSIDRSYSTGWDLCITTLKNGFLSKADQYFLSLIRKYFKTPQA